ncbi:MAG: hypothetical protein Q8761_03340, partial [Sweet potato little leaf phytoplasma]|nr:hypothetical protein [Sweet potato little leaf phytoplasma]
MSLMRATKLLMQGARPLRPQDVFATSLYTGNGGTQTITTGVDSTDGLLWIKPRSTEGDHILFCSSPPSNGR